MRQSIPSPGSVQVPLGSSSGRWCVRSPSKTNVGNVPGDFIHRVVFFQVCTLRSIWIYVWIDTLNSARHSAKIRSFLPRCFRPLPQLDPPVDSARRANDNAVTFAFARERFQVKSEVFFVSWGKALLWQFNGALFFLAFLTRDEEGFIASSCLPTGLVSLFYASARTTTVAPFVATPQ